jgi:3',5'-cyclic AMP phosphodiesterase CpdA
LLIAQITDTHIGFDRDNPAEHNLVRLQALLARLADGPNRPDLLLLTGDLTEHGDAASYRRLANALAECPIPIRPIPGNHDDRAALLEVFPDTPSTDGFIQYALDDGDLRVLMLDTLEPGRHGASFCETRASWLAGQLAAHPDRPTLIAMHHPPFASGIVWMDPDPADPWIACFADAMRGHEQVVGIVSGHVHRPVTSRWDKASMVIAPSSAPAISLDLSPVDPADPDGRALIRSEPPGYALHRWDGRSLVTHFESIGGYRSVARFDEKLQPMIRDMMGEGPTG